MKKQKKLESKDEKITFLAKKCSKCGDLLVVRKLGVWGYYCINCNFWWGTYDPYPIVKKLKNQD